MTKTLHVLIAAETLPASLLDAMKRTYTVSTGDAVRDPAWSATYGAEIDVILTNGVTGVTAELLRRLPKLKLIASSGVGVDKIDLAAAFGMDIHYYNPHSQPAVPYRRHDSLRSLVAAADYLVLTLPGGDATRHAVEETVLAALGPLNGYLPAGWSLEQWQATRQSDPEAVIRAALIKHRRRRDLGQSASRRRRGHGFLAARGYDDRLRR